MNKSRLLTLCLPLLLVSCGVQESSSLFSSGVSSSSSSSLETISSSISSVSAETILFNGKPSIVLGKIGDYGKDITIGLIYLKTGNGWMPYEAEEGFDLIQGKGEPGSYGKKGDLYYEVQNHAIYQKGDEGWKFIRFDDTPTSSSSSEPTSSISSSEVISSSSSSEVISHSSSSEAISDSSSSEVISNSSSSEVISKEPSSLSESSSSSSGEVISSQSSSNISISVSPSLSSSSASSQSSVSSLSLPEREFNFGLPDTTASSLKTTNIDLNDSSEAEIRDYYAYVDYLEPEEKTGKNLLKNLKKILQNGHHFIKYSNLWAVYEITDRDWELSPASADSYASYNASENIYTSYSYGSNSSPKNNPYVHTLYRNRGNAEGYIREYGDHSITGTNREHVWPKSLGFGSSLGESDGLAYNDLHHLMSGDAKVNQQHHNNESYGFVDKNKTIAINGDTDADSFRKGNYRGISKTKGGGNVFEPQDCDKGDIARACFYMMARYNNLSGNEKITYANPNLELVDYISVSVTDSSSTTTGKVGILSDLLEWHKMDPVDEYEIHRNNLIYKNYQNNRNPFVDYPSWVDVIWGKENKTASALLDKIALA